MSSRPTAYAICGLSALPAKTDKQEKTGISLYQNKKEKTNESL